MYTTTMSALPITSGAIALSRDAINPIVMTKKRVPTNSVRYLRMGRSQWREGGKAESGKRKGGKAGGRGGGKAERRGEGARAAGDARGRAGAGRRGEGGAAWGAPRRRGAWPWRSGPPRTGRRR